jgi:hypothetical protein
MFLEVLHLAFMLLGFLKCVERAKIASLSCGFALLSRIQTILAGFEFSDHIEVDAERRPSAAWTSFSPSDEASE